MLSQPCTDLAADRNLIDMDLERDVMTYIRDRIIGRASSVPFLDQMPFDEAMDACTLIGAVRIAGLHYDNAHYQDRDLGWKSTVDGFAVARHGEQAVEQMLTDLVTAEGLPLGFGLACMRRLHQRLSQYEPVDRHLALKKLLIRVGHALGMIHFDTTEVYGLPVPAARFVGVNHAAVIFKCNKRRLRSILIGMGHLAESSLDMPEIRVAVDLFELGLTLVDISEALNLGEAGEIVGVSGTHMSQLVDMGSIPVLYEYHRPDGRSLRHIKRATMTNYVRTVLEQAVMLPPELEGCDTLCTFDEIPGRIIKPRYLVLDLVARKQLQHVYSRTENPTLADVLVDTAEVVTFYDEREVDELDVRQAADLLGASICSMQYLSMHRHLPFHIRPNPVNGRRQRTWSRNDVLAFEREYISLGRLSRAIDRNPNFVTKRLKKDGILPAISNVAMHIYRRDDVRMCTTVSIAEAHNCPVLPRRPQPWITAMWDRRRAEKATNETD